MEFVFFLITWVRGRFYVLCFMFYVYLGGYADGWMDACMHRWLSNYYELITTFFVCFTFALLGFYTHVPSVFFYIHRACIVGGWVCWIDVVYLGF